MIRSLFVIVISVYFFGYPLVVYALTEQDVEDFVDYDMGLKTWVDDKVTDASPGELNPILIHLLAKYTGETARQKEVLDMMRKYPEGSMIPSILSAYSSNKDLEEDVVGLLLEIDTDEAYLEAKKIVFNPLMGRDIKGYDPLNDIPLLLSKTTAKRLQYILPYLRQGGLVTRWIIDALIEKGSPDVIIPPIAGLLRGSDGATRIYAVEALGKIGNRSAVPYLRDALKTENELSLKMDIAAQLVKLGEFGNLELLVQAVGDQSKDIREAAANWLRETTGQNFGEDQQQWREWFEDEKKKRGL